MKRQKISVTPLSFPITETFCEKASLFFVVEKEQKEMFFRISAMENK